MWFEIDNNHCLILCKVIGFVVKGGVNLLRQTGFTISTMLSMGTIQTSATLPSAKTISTPLPIIAALEAKIAIAGDEMDFYQKLLSWLLFSCREEKRHIVEKLRADLADLRNGGFSVLLEGLATLKNELQNEMGHPDLFMDLAHLQLYFNHIDGALQSLKSKIHRGFGDFTHIRIW